MTIIFSDTKKVWCILKIEHTDTGYTRHARLSTGPTIVSLTSNWSSNMDQHHGILSVNKLIPWI